MLMGLCVPVRSMTVTVTAAMKRVEEETVTKWWKTKRETLWSSTVSLRVLKDGGGKLTLPFGRGSERVISSISDDSIPLAGLSMGLAMISRMQKSGKAFTEVLAQIEERVSTDFPFILVRLIYLSIYVGSNSCRTTERI